MRDLSTAIAAFFFAAGVLTAGGNLSAKQPPISVFGDYECDIERAARLSRTAENIDAENAPQSFTFSAYESPVTPEELQRPLRKLESIEPEAERIFSASIAAPLFAFPLNALRSADRRSYAQNGAVFVFENDLSFFAYGPAPDGAAQGVIAYYGGCRAPK